MSSAWPPRVGQVLAHDAVALLRDPLEVLAPRERVEADARATGRPSRARAASISRMCAAELGAHLVDVLGLAPESSSCAPGSSVTDAPPRMSAMMGPAVVLALGRPARAFEPGARGRAATLRSPW